MKKTNKSTLKSIKHIKVKKQTIVKDINDKPIVTEFGYEESSTSYFNKPKKVVCRLLDPKFPKN